MLGRGSEVIKAGDLPKVANPHSAPRKQNKQIGHSGRVDKRGWGGAEAVEEGCVKDRAVLPKNY